MEDCFFYECALKAKKDGKYDECISILKEGSKNNDPECIYLLVVSYIGHHGYILRKHRQKAFNLFKKNNNHFKSMSMICFLSRYPDNFDNIKDDGLGNKILNSFGNHYAKGCCFKYGFGTEINEEKAFKEFLISAEEGDDQGQYEVGYCFKRGLGVIVNKKKAYEWFLKSGEQHNDDAMFELTGYPGDGVELLNAFEKSIYWTKKYCKWSGEYFPLKNLLKININIKTCDLDSLINLKLANHYLSKDEYNEYLSWHFYKKTKEIDGKKELKELEGSTFKRFVECYKVIRTVLCIGKFSKYPKEVFMLIGKEIFGQIKKK
jgi:hypothetical protein